ncbi:MAG TPA: TatD family hydrolase [Gammaproteobacteria bacterium]|nr:TatD family hydrolase [Gammaproteobacteria bacterium]
MSEGEIELIDIGANLTHKSFARDLEAVLRRARQAGLSQILVTGSGLEASRAAIELARTHPARLFATAGVHPHEASAHGGTELAAIADLARAPEVHAVGELGLDFNRNYSPRADQERVFTAQLEMAVDLGKPLFLHQRDAHARFLEILDPFIERVAGAVVHCFTAGAYELDAYLERGLHVGITGWFCDERRGAHLRELVSRVPGERLMLETDAPYLLPRDLRPRPKDRRNEPAYLRHILAAVAVARGESPAALAATTTSNARRLFRLPSP